MKRISILLSVFFTTLFAFSVNAGDDIGDHPSEIAVKIIDQFFVLHNTIASV